MFTTSSQMAQEKKNKRENANMENINIWKIVKFFV